MICMCAHNGKMGNERKYRHMSLIPFYVCAYAAIHYEGRRLMNELITEKEDD